MTLEELAALAAAASPAAASDVMAMAGHRHAHWLRGLAARTPAPRLFGEAVTLRCLPARPDLAAELRAAVDGDPARLAFDAAVEATAPLRVLVVDMAGLADACLGGEIRFGRLADTGAAGLVCDGAIRDSRAVAELGLPVFTRELTPCAGTGMRHQPYEWDRPIACAGVLVRPGDILLGDEDGVVVLPRGLAPDILRKAAAKEAADRYVAAKVRAQGVPSATLYPPDAALLAEIVEATGISRADLPF